MGTTEQTYSRKATFRQQTVKGQKYFTPVNKRAQRVMRKLHKRTKVTPEQLAQAKGLGSYTFHVYTGNGKLKAI
jgi:hypothetical protein